MDFYEEIVHEIRTGNVKTKEQLQSRKMQLAKRYNLDYIPGDVEILNSAEFDEQYLDLLRIKPTRTISGVAVVAAMTSPDRCPHGKCIYCPGGLENNSPQAYTGYEPAALRGRSNGYDGYNQVFNRLKQLDTIGHDTSKVDLIIMGGTFTARPREYQESFVKGCLDGMNMSISNTLDESILQNEGAGRRCIGLTVETKPDWFFEKEIDLSLRYGATKVELGVQNISERILRKNGRGHGIAEIVKSTQLSRDAGLKMVYHLMPGMPGASIEDDKKSFDLMIKDPAYRPDMLKIYPTLVVKGTAIYRMWKQGKYMPLDTDSAVDLITYFMKNMPPWIRVQRMQRDIPVKFIESGVKRSDIRNMVDDRLNELGINTMEMRSREIGRVPEMGEEPALRRRNYEASGGKEIFISYETQDNRIVGFVRLRIPSDSAHRKEMADSSVIREIKVFGSVVPVGDKAGGRWQHKGFGGLLMAEAERITREEYGLGRILVISGIGVREYFRRMGYERVGPYMGKRLQ
ncbi:hypothetical protein IX51_10880 [uncultured archaeon]|nr:hypothetical protein IX51_10880 [uncultured archaeon]